MSMRITCGGCKAPLRVPDEAVGQQVRCPHCNHVVPILDPAATAASSETVEDNSSLTFREEAPATPPPVHLPLPTTAPGVPRSKKKKKKRSIEEPSPQGIPGWVWSVGILGIVIFALLIVAAVMVANGQAMDALVYGITLLILLPISGAILFASMLISSHLGGGIDFGDVKEVLPKAAALLLVMNTMGLFPYGSYIALPFWLVGLMLLFRLDMWEARFLFGINWLFNAILQLLLMGAIFSYMAKEEKRQEQLQYEGRAPAPWTTPSGPLTVRSDTTSARRLA